MYCDTLAWILVTDLLSLIVIKEYKIKCIDWANFFCWLLVIEPQGSEPGLPIRLLNQHIHGHHHLNLTTATTSSQKFAGIFCFQKKYTNKTSSSVIKPRLLKLWKAKNRAYKLIHVDCTLGSKRTSFFLHQNWDYARKCIDFNKYKLI